MEVGRIFGQVLKKIRTAKGVSQSELAHLAELDRTYISLIERGLRKPTIDVVFKISEALQLKASFILEQIENYNED